LRPVSKYRAKLSGRMPELEARRFGKKHRQSPTHFSLGLGVRFGAVRIGNFFANA